MNSQEIENVIANNKSVVLTKKELADIMHYKANNIKAHIPAWVFRKVALYLTE